MRILHLPTSVGGNSWGLSQGERHIGLDSTVLVYGTNYLQYKADRVISIPSHGILKKPIALTKLINTFGEIRNKYEVFHFNFGSSLIDAPRYGMNALDLIHLRLSFLLLTTGVMRDKNTQRCNEHLLLLVITLGVMEECVTLESWTKCVKRK